MVECKWAGTVSVTGVGSEDWFTTGRKVDVLGLGLDFSMKLTDSLDSGLCPYSEFIE